MGATPNSTKVARAIVLAAIVAIFVVAIYLILKISIQVVEKSKNELSMSFVGALIGVLFGSFSLIISGWIKSYLDRRRAANDALFHLEGFFNFQLDHIFQNQFLINQYSAVLNNLLKLRPRVFIHEFTFVQTEEFPKEWTNLVNLDLINECFVIQLNLGKMTIDINETMNIKRRLETHYPEAIAGGIELEQLIGPAIRRNASLITELGKTRNRILDAMAVIRCHQKRKPALIWVSQAIQTFFVPKVSKEEIEVEKQGLIAEMTDSIATSRKG